MQDLYLCLMYQRGCTDTLVNGSRWFVTGHENELTQFSEKQGCMSELSGLSLGRQLCVVCRAQCRTVQGWHACVWLIINQQSLGSLTTLFTAWDRHMGLWMGLFSGVIAHPGCLPCLNGRPGQRTGLQKTAMQLCCVYSWFLWSLCPYTHRYDR